MNKYQELAREFIREYNKSHEWSPFDGIERASIGLFAMWLDKKEELK